MSDALQAGRAASIPAAAIAAIHRAAARELDPTGAAKLLRQIGLETGPALHAHFWDWIAESRMAVPTDPEDLDFDEFWRRLGGFFDSLGFGSLELEQLHPAVFALSSTDWIEAAVEQEGHQGCQLTTGLLAGFLKEVAQQDLAVLEVQCRGTGDDHCRFLAGSPEALQQIFERMQLGSPYADAVATLS
jgi:predicted hydrocarbon binding protein